MMLPTSTLSPTRFDVFLTCLGLTRGPCLPWRHAAGASICIAHIMGMTPGTKVQGTGYRVQGRAGQGRASKTYD